MRKADYQRINPSKLDIQKTPDRLREHAERTGIKYGIGVSNFIWNLFVLNETLPRMKKMTDTEIVRQIIEEYRKYKDTVAYYSKTSHCIVEARARFNRGIIGPNPQLRIPPEVLSYRYNAEGKRVYRGKVASEKVELRIQAHWTAVHMDRMLEYPRLWMLPTDHPLVIQERKTFLKKSEKLKNVKKEYKARRLREVQGEEE